ncbi:Uma2 family endonuclease [Allorhizocola rhizosphaerae]|uniref:Uma2 family endonuclease n=1 Tax=Allorhizocola rhizosphaerae TaxID=1872709 RepID=UPI000E3BE5AD|nr:Uma2 family endonuclease [Allorhizocola rhizosphaerae]
MTDLLVQAWLPSRALRVDDMWSIDLEAPFEISDGKLEIMTPPSPWHEFTADMIKDLLKRHYPSATGDVPVPIGDNGRRPDVVALLQTRDELLRQRLKRFTADMIAVAVEVISHDPDKWQDKKSVDRDREVKFHEYAGAGIPEYWIVDEVADDPTDAAIEIYHLSDGRYAPALLTRLSKLTNGEVELPRRRD